MRKHELTRFEEIVLECERREVAIGTLKGMNAHLASKLELLSRFVGAMERTESRQLMFDPKMTLPAHEINIAFKGILEQLNKPNRGQSPIDWNLI